jgi:bifunctional non-homologous end joining protein LigD
VFADDSGMASFQLFRHRRNEPAAFLYAFDLLELNGADLRKEAIEVRKAKLASILRKARPGVRLNGARVAGEVANHVCSRHSLS